jgi:hypothetical protein
MLNGLLPRFEQQVELVDADILLRNWQVVEAGRA